MKLRNHRDFWAGVMFFAFGLAFVLLAQQYQMGNAARMGPAYFPTALGALLALLGAIIVFNAFAKGNVELRLQAVGWRENVLVLLSVILFGLLLPGMGMVVAIMVLILVSALAGHEFRFRESLISAVVLTVMSYLVFALGLELQFRVWPAFLTP
ncbi:MAG: tripartite tricarboxylate transporter TctB family protein [Burkholderiaceae bacterium]|nr:tripartite tricarboxylate transporter TctB family protein [Burkholderiaceae bacterium]